MGFLYVLCENLVQIGSEMRPVPCEQTYESAQESEHLVKFFTRKSVAIIDKILIEGHKSRSINGVSVPCPKSRTKVNKCNRRFHINQVIVNI